MREKNNLYFIFKNHIPWNKGLKTGPHSEETKEKMRKKARRGKDNHNYGKHLSDDVKRKLSVANSGENSPWLGKHHSDKTKEKMSKTAKGKLKSEEHKRNLSIAMKGRKVWNKGIPRDEKTKEKISKKLKGKKQSEETIRKMKKTREGKKPALGKHWKLSEETKQKQREKRLLHIQNNSGPFKDTKPELKMKEILNELNIPFEHQFRLCRYLFDFHILNTNILIEVDGDYYHGNPEKYSNLNETQQKVKQKDIIKDKVAKTNNFILLRFWESNILNNKENVKNCIIETLKR